MKKAILPFIVFLSCNAQAVPLVCSDVFNSELEVNKLSQEADQLIGIIKASELMAPLVQREKIYWKTFDSMNRVTAAIESYALFLNKMTPTERRTEQQQMLRRLDQLEKDDPSVAALFNGDFSKIPEGTYKPTEYKLRRELQSKLSAALQKLPVEFRPRISKLPYDKNTTAINNAAVKLMKEQEASFDRLFKQSTGMDYAAFEKNLRSIEDPELKMALDIIDADQIEVTMRRPEGGRFWIPRIGFQNQYVSGSSKGFLGEKRKNAESLMTDKNIREYWDLNEEVMPKYGTLKAAKESGRINDLTGSEQYGPDFYTFKKSALKDRLSFFPGDSLNHLRIPWSQTTLMKLIPTSWDNLFIPWSRRLLMVPFMVEEIRKGDHFMMPMYSEFVPEGFPVRSHQYWESQIFGKLTLDMVETFEFTSTPPSGEFLAELKKHNIKIIDGRSQPASEWKEE